MRALALIAALLLTLCVGASAGACAEGAEETAALSEQELERAGFGGFAALAKELGGLDAKALLKRALAGELRLDIDDAQRLIRRFCAWVKDAFLEALAALAAPVLAGVALRALLGKNGGSSMALLCRLACASVLMARYARDGQIAAWALDSAAKLTESASPVLASVMAMTGAGGAARILSPSAALCAGVIRRVLGEIALPLCGVAAVVASSANLSDHFQLNRLFALLGRGVAGVVRLSMAAFAGLMALEGLLAPGQDGFAVRVVGRALQGALPIVGGQLADSAGALADSAALLRSAVGVTGMAAVLAACASPAVRLAVSMVALQLAAAVLEPVADPGVVRLIGHFARLGQLLLAICAGCALLCVLLMGGCLGLAAA